MRNYKHLTITQRLQLETMLKLKKSKKEIADFLGVHISTVYREIKRGEYDYLNGNTWLIEKRYSPNLAEDKYRSNLLDKGANLKIGKDYSLVNYIETRIIKDKLSPLAVIGEIKAKGLQFKTQICFTTVYNYIKKEIFPNLEAKHLPMYREKKKRKKSLAIKRAPRGTSIEKRPPEINERKTFGHWEMDCVCGSTKNVLLVLTERLTRKEIILPMKNQTAENVVHCLNSIEHQYGKKFKKLFKSITVDNGTEFSNFIGLEKSKFGKCKRTDVYYCHPYSSYERGTNERINREIRRIIPKGTNLANYTFDEIKDVEKWVNEYPRQIFDFKTSQEQFEFYYQQL